MTTPTTPTTLFEKIWQRHVIANEVASSAIEATPETLYIDLHLVHEVTSPQAFAELNRRGLKVRRPGQTVATMDHSTSTKPGVTLPINWNNWPAIASITVSLSSTSTASGAASSM